MSCAINFAITKKRGLRGNFVGDSFDEKMINTVLQTWPEIEISDEHLLIAIWRASVGVLKLLYYHIKPERPTIIYDDLWTKAASGFDTKSPVGWI